MLRKEIAKVKRLMRKEVIRFHPKLKNNLQMLALYGIGGR